MGGPRGPWGPKRRDGRTAPTSRALAGARAVGRGARDRGAVRRRSSPTYSTTGSPTTCRRTPTRPRSPGSRSSCPAARPPSWSSSTTATADSPPPTGRRPPDRSTRIAGDTRPGGAPRRAYRPPTAPPSCTRCQQRARHRRGEARRPRPGRTRSRPRRGDGLGVEVGGPGALATDADEVFDSLDGPLIYTTVAVVALLLILIYRSPLLWLVPARRASGIAAFLSMGVAYGLDQAFGRPSPARARGIMTVLVFGAGTDYALLLVARYREELRRIERPYDAMRAALRGCGPAVLASSGTVAAGLLCLLAADLNTSRGLGPFGAVGRAVRARRDADPAARGPGAAGPPGVLAAGPRLRQRRPSRAGSLFAAMGSSAGRRPLAVLASGAVLLGRARPGRAEPARHRSSRRTPSPTSPSRSPRCRRWPRPIPERGTQPIERHHPGRTGRRGPSPTIRARRRRRDAPNGRSGGGWTEISVFAEARPQSAAETATIERLRDGPRRLVRRRRRAPSRSTSTTPTPATGWSSSRSSSLSVLLILIALLRSLVAPLLLVAAVVAVWGAALGIGGLVFGPVLGFDGTDPGLALLSFVFLVALGVDYGIFLMHRMREESLRRRRTGGRRAHRAAHHRRRDRLGRARPRGDLRGADEHAAWCNSSSWASSSRSGCCWTPSSSARTW